jgi:diadenosine tetraphosphatase ApaH/serine/threonine PP2A family protein phosphatase
MRCAILGDIHANLQALQAVLADAHECECTEFHCLGDVVGYNANPSECLQLVRSLPGVCVLGNHDEAAAGDGSLQHFSPLAAASLEWTRAQLSEDQKRWLTALRPVRQIRRFTLVHATLDSPGSWAYVRTPSAAELNFSCQRTSAAFFGHTHVPGMFVQGDGGEHFLQEEGMRLPEGRKIFVNAGSVGQPRDGDWRASYLIHDEESGGLWLRRVEYDIDGARQSILKAGLPVRLAERLLSGS